MPARPTPSCENLRCPILPPRSSQSDTTCSCDAQSMPTNHLGCSCMMQSPLIGAVTTPSDRAADLRAHRNPSRSLYWRSQARSPHWASVAAASPGHISSKVLTNRLGHGGKRLLPANRLGSGKLRDWSAGARSVPYASLRVPSGRVIPTNRVERGTGGTSAVTATRPPRGKMTPSCTWQSRPFATQKSPQRFE